MKKNPLGRRRGAALSGDRSRFHQQGYVGPGGWRAGGRCGSSPAAQ